MTSQSVVVTGVYISLSIWVGTENKILFPSVSVN